MGFADRQYARRDYGPSTTVGAIRLWSITTWLIVINVAVFLLNALTRTPENGGTGWFDLWGYFSADTVIHGLQVWRFLSFQFLHANLEHLIFNMFALYVFGPIIEGYLGRWKYLAFYLLCGIGGALMYLALWLFGILQYGAATELVGASAGIFGILVAGAKVAPDTTVMLIFPPIPLRLRVLALVLLGIAVYVVFSNGGNAGGEAAHLGGAAMGALLIWQPQVLGVFERWPFRRGRRYAVRRQWWKP